MRAVIFTLGCKVNEVESAQIAAELEKRGIDTDDKLSPADIYVLNTCAVTKEAERKSRQLISRAKKFNPEAKIYVCGCASEKNGKQFETDGVVYVGGARGKQAVVSKIAEDFHLCPCDGLGYPKQLKTRAFIKIEDGCDNFCSYCVIPYLRGRVDCRLAEDIINEVKSCSAPEVVLTGINISAYKNLTELIRSLAFTDKRIRLGSLECGVIDEGFLSACKALKDFAPQFHLSLQSGSDRVLKLMNRHYTREEYLKKCALIYSYFPNAAITTDIIAGFCGESEEDFKESLSIIEEAGFARVHAFAFSPREGTRAYSLEDVPNDIKSDRLHRLLEAGKSAVEKFISARLNRTAEVIAEEFDGTYTTGYTAEYIKVFIKGKVEGRCGVVLEKPFSGGALARVVSKI